jgi:NADH-quinone oxidoreductase subunit N
MHAVPNLLSALPEIILVVMASVILILDAFLPDDQRHIGFWLAQLALLACAVVTIANPHYEISRNFSNMLVSDLLGDVLKFCAYVAVSMTLFYSRTYLSLRGLFRGEFFVLSLFALVGILAMISANNFLILYLGLELMSLCLYAMVALERDSRQRSEAAMKYFVLGAIASGLLLYGMSMIYGATGTLDIDQIRQAIFTGHASRTVLVFGLVFLVSGIGFKLGAVPYHMWVPDVYHGAPTAVTLMIGAAPKIAAYAFTIRLLVGALPLVAEQWQQMLIVLSLLSMIIGNVTAIAQTNIKRMLAYSTIANMGFMLLGILAGKTWGYSAAMFYTVAYVLTTLASFGMVMLLSRDGFEAENLDDFKGLNQRSPWYAFIMLLVMFSLAGLPPTIGFYAKLTVIEAAISADLVWLAVAAVATSLIGAFYYLRVVKLMYFDAPLDTAPITPRGDMHVILSANGLSLLVLGIFPQYLLGLCVVALNHSPYG